MKGLCYRLQSAVADFEKDPSALTVLMRFLDELYLRSDFYLAIAPATSAGETTAVQRAAAATVSKAQLEVDARLVVATREATSPKEP